MSGIAYRFQDWLCCPDCEENSDTGILAYGTDVVIECYDCGMTSEYTIGQDVPVSNLDTDDIDRFTDESDDDRAERDRFADDERFTESN